MTLNASGEVLLVRTPRRGWEPPGGQVELGEDIPTALHREVLEESGCEVRIQRLVGVYSNVTAPQKIILCFRCAHLSGVPRAGDECTDAGWFQTADALEQVLHEANRMRLRDALDGQSSVVYTSYTTEPFRQRTASDW